MEKLLTVTEVAAYLRTTTTTIYRWLKQGRLSAVKIGKEWRISEEQLKSVMSSGSKISNSLWDKLNKKEHLLLITEKDSEITEFEVSFFRRALSEGAGIMKGCWWQETDKVCEQYERNGLDVKTLEKEGLLNVIDFQSLYRKEGVEGPLRAWSAGIESAVAKGHTRLWASGSPAMDCIGGNAEALLSFEARLNQAIQDMPVIGICPYSLENPSNYKNFSKLISLMDCHSGVVFYGKNQCKLLRQ